MAKKLTTPDGDILPAGSKDITPEDSVTPVYLVPLTAEQEAEREVWVQEQAARDKAEADAAALKESALAKLAKLGLTEDEAKAVIGL